MLEHLCTKVPQFEVWGEGFDEFPENSPVRQHYRGKAWGIDMYQVLHNSNITVNQHAEVAKTYASNKRLFEATGVGTMLVTDWKLNLHEMFEPGKEVVVYRTPEECAKVIDYYLGHEEERRAIAHAGQHRTLRDHTYEQRAQDLAEIVEKYVQP
jgi:spore maturation protein CgeB